MEGLKIALSIYGYAFLVYVLVVIVTGLNA